MMLAGGKVIRHGILEHGALGQLLGVEYLLRATFNRADIALAAGDLEAQAPGSVQDGALTLVETDGQLEIKSNKLEVTTAQATPVWGDLGGYEPVGIARALGRALMGEIQTVSGVFSVVGWSNQSAAVWSGLYNDVWLHSTGGNLMVLTENTSNILVAQIPLGFYDIAIVLGGFDSSGLPYYAGQTKSSYAQGAWFFIKGGAFTNWTLLYVTEKRNTATVYPVVSWHQGATVTADNLRVPDVDLSSAQVPVAFSSFTGSNGTSLDAITPEVGPAWVEQSGNWDIQTNRAACNGAGIATTNDGIANGLFRGVVNTGTDDNPARVVRFTDTSNYWYLQADQANNLHELHEVNATVDTVRASTAKTFNASTDYTLVAIPDGETITGFADNASRITYASATLNQTATRHGIRAETANGRFDNPVSYARTSNAYNILDTV